MGCKIKKICDCKIRSQGIPIFTVRKASLLVKSIWYIAQFFFEKYLALKNEAYFP